MLGPMLEVVAATDDDIPSWLALVREVEPLFGPMPDFDLRPAISRGVALCVPDEAGGVAGGVIVAPERASISWLAVRGRSRGAGVGRRLVAGALKRLPTGCEIIVDTFGEDNIEGRPARRLYESCGFRPAEMLDPGPEGGTRQRFRLVVGEPSRRTPGT